MKWKLFFVAQPQTDAEGNKYYELGTYTVPKTKTVWVKSEGAFDLFVYVTSNDSLANYAYSLPEFVGVNSPTDIATRHAYNLSNAASTLQMKHMIGAHWVETDPELGNYWVFGSCHDWEAAGSPEPVWFGSFRKILGVEYD